MNGELNHKCVPIVLSIDSLLHRDMLLWNISIDEMGIYLKKQLNQQHWIQNNSFCVWEREREETKSSLCVYF